MRHANSLISLLLCLLLLLNLAASIGVFARLDCMPSDLAGSGDRYVTCIVDGKAETFQKVFKD